MSAQDRKKCLKLEQKIQVRVDDHVREREGFVLTPLVSVVLSLDQVVTQGYQVRAQRLEESVRAAMDALDTAEIELGMSCVMCHRLSR